jgi:hypothetical protein
MRNYVFVLAAVLAGCQSMENRNRDEGSAWLIKSTADRTSGVIGTDISAEVPERQRNTALVKATGCAQGALFGAMERKTRQRLVTIPWTLYGGAVVPLSHQVTDSWFEIEFECVGRELSSK